LNQLRTNKNVMSAKSAIQPWRIDFALAGKLETRLHLSRVPIIDTNRSAHLGEQVQHVVGVLFFHLIDLLDQYFGGRIAIAQPSDDV
jgi:hypothetical protein